MLHPILGVILTAYSGTVRFIANDAIAEGGIERVPFWGCRVFCPQCRYEFKEGITVCPDCGVPLLVELPSKQKLPPKPMTKHVDLEPVFSTIDPALLALAKSRLDEEDIPYLVKNERLQQVYLLAIGIEERLVEIWVRKDDLGEARELLQDFLIDAQHSA